MIYLKLSKTELLNKWKVPATHSELRGNLHEKDRLCTISR